jgi:PAS domain S-box-containing protein
MSDTLEMNEINEQLNELQKDIDHHRALVARFQSMLRSIPDGLICTDRDGIIFEVNGTVEKLLGFTEDELCGNTPEFFYRDKKEYTKQRTYWFPENQTAVHTPFEAGFTNKQKNGLTVEILSTCVTNTSGELLCYLSLIRDISKRKKLEERLRTKESTFRTVADFTYDWEIWLHPDGTYRYISPSCLRITGYSPEEFSTDPSLFESIIHRQDRTVWEEHHAENQEQRLQQREVQFRIIKKDGSTAWIEHACQTVIGKNGEILGYRSSNRDITKRKNFETELSSALLEIERYKEQLEAESAYLQEEIKLEYNYESIVGTSNALQYVLGKREQGRSCSPEPFTIPAGVKAGPWSRSTVPICPPL